MPRIQLIFGTFLLYASLFTLPSSTMAASEDGPHHPTQAPEINITDFGYGDQQLKNEYGEDVPMPPPLVLAIFNFLVFIGILYWKAGPALRKYLSERSKTITGALAEAARLQNEAKQKLAEYSARIADVDEEVNSLIKKIRSDADAESKRIVGDAERQAQQMKRDAEERIASAFLVARHQLEQELITKATEAAERLIGQTTTTDDHNRLFTSFVSELNANEVMVSTERGGR